MLRRQAFGATVSADGTPQASVVWATHDDGDGWRGDDGTEHHRLVGQLRPTRVIEH